MNTFTPGYILQIVSELIDGCSSDLPQTVETALAISALYTVEANILAFLERLNKGK